MLDRVERYVTGAPSAPPAERVLTTMLFVEVVSSTSPAAGAGGSDPLDRARQQVAMTGGTLVNTAGDGLLATFDGPARAVRCGLTLVADLANLGLDVRCSAHTSEVERLADGIAGIGVQVGERVEDLARPGEVLVTRTVRDLVVGSGLHFEPWGRHELPGVPDCWARWRRHERGAVRVRRTRRSTPTGSRAARRRGRARRAAGVRRPGVPRRAAPRLGGDEGRASSTGVGRPVRARVGADLARSSHASTAVGDDGTRADGGAAPCTAAATSSSPRWSRRHDRRATVPCSPRDPPPVEQEIRFCTSPRRRAPRLRERRVTGRRWCGPPTG